MAGDLVLVTGVSGYLGSHVVDRLVKEGYRVRGTVRAAKLAQNQKAFSAVYGDAVEVIAMDDLIKGIYPDAFKGVAAVIHVAAPLPAREASAEVAISVAVDGSLNIFTQAEQAGVVNFSFASSIITFNTGFPDGEARLLRNDEWIPITKEYVLSLEKPPAFVVYAAEKAEAERAVWKFADEHPHVEVTTVNPPFFYGPFAPGHRGLFEGATYSAQNASTMATPFFHNMIRPDAPPPPPDFVDIRDVARALVASLTAPPTSKVGRKRILLASEVVQVRDIASFIAKERPELASRVSSIALNTEPNLKAVVDNLRLKEVLNLEPTPWTTTILDAVDALVKLENHWKSRGVDILENVPTTGWLDIA
ncbi:hypothetical protein EUX98_g5354 [Antrodiella citrinella]|uniref:NAD-dependent epimerase/dehydratase domain-containing protein n=1 Tax=Antrodiella citrinella TaxID=2447956 RepID=A0A4S4MRM2_9APHY|nr:hypothetical protein EUX98_g5354 [Antrodiella citrinella]